MKLGIDWQKLPEGRKRGAMGSLDFTHELCLEGLFFPTTLDMSPTLDIAELRDLRRKADDLGLYLEAGLGKINPYCNAENPDLRAAGDGDIIAGFTKMIERTAQIGCHELWVSPGNFKPQYQGRLAVDRFRTDVEWGEQLAAMARVMVKLAPVARAHGTHLNMETHDEITSFEILRLIETVGEDVMGVVLDTANMLQRGEHPVRATKRLAPYIRQTHLKDAFSGRAPAGIDFQPRACGDGIVPFAEILPIILAANPQINFSLEISQSNDLAPKTKAPRQCIQIDDPVWRAGHPDLDAAELAAYLDLMDKVDARLLAGTLESWEDYERRVYDYPDYAKPLFGVTAAKAYIERSAKYIRSLLPKMR